MKIMLFFFLLVSNRQQKIKSIISILMISKFIELKKEYFMNIVVCQMAGIKGKVLLHFIYK